MKLWIIVLLAICTITYHSHPVLAQKTKRENIWCFGYQAKIDFNSGVPVSTAPSDMMWGLAAATVCDTNGQLLFYTNGDVVWNRLDKRMLSDTELLITDPFLPALDSGYTHPVALEGYVCGGNFFNCGSTMIVPIPDSSSKYYIFSLTSSQSAYSMLDTFGGRLYYSVVDMNLNNGLGGIIDGRRAILLDSGLITNYTYETDNVITGVMGNRCNIWLLATSRSPSNGIVLKAYSITSTGINPNPAISSLSIPGRWGAGAQVVVSPDRKKLAYAPNATIYDFDAYTGTVSNPVSYLTPQNPYWNTPQYSHVAFSPDNTKLYVAAANGAGANTIDQYDLSSGDSATIVASKTQVATDGGSMRIGPDNKIYINGGFNQGLGLAPYLYGTINFPNLPGTACQFNFGVPRLGPYQRAASYLLPNVVPELVRDTAKIKRISAAPACIESTITLKAYDSTGWDYKWSNADTGYTYIAKESGTYILQYYTPICTFHEDSFDVKFFSLPLQDLGNDTIYCTEDKINRELAAELTDSVSVLWSTGQTTRFINVEDTGTYWVKVAYDVCSISDTIHILNKRCECHLVIPSAFSPNGDGKNDVFRPFVPIGCAIKGYQLKIYNRWGQNVYTTTTINDGWDGNINGLPADIGIYMYSLITGTDEQHTTIQQNGDIALIR